MSLKSNVITVNGYSIHPHVSENRRGSYGYVVDARRLSDGKEFVMKFFGYTKQKPDIAYILREIDNLQILKTLTGVAHIETIFNDSIEGYISRAIPKLHRRVYPIIVMEKLHGGELFETILSKQDHGEKFSEHEAAIIFKTFITALEKIHNEKNMIVVDLKSENLVFADNKNYNSIKVIDFGRYIVIYHIMQFC
jgi:serine/threonine protein kinase